MGMLSWQQSKVKNRSALQVSYFLGEAKLYEIRVNVLWSDFPVVIMEKGELYSYPVLVVRYSLQHVSEEIKM